MHQGCAKTSDREILYECFYLVGFLPVANIPVTLARVRTVRERLTGGYEGVCLVHPALVYILPPSFENRLQTSLRDQRWDTILTIATSWPPCPGLFAQSLAARRL